MICFPQENVSLFFPSQNQQLFYIKYFELNNIDFRKNENYIIVNKNTDLLKRILEIEKLRIDIIRNNINNIYTTRTTNNNPFIRRYVCIENEIVIKEDVDRNLMFVFNPWHPDAYQNGYRQGYVEIPNIDVINEFYELNNALQLINNIVEYFLRNYDEIIIDEIIIDKTINFTKEYFIQLLNLRNSELIGYKSQSVRYEYCYIENKRREEIFINFSQGALINTSRELDFAIDGQGFFKIILENNIVGYTRNGEFKIDENTNELVTIDGYSLYNKIIIPPGFTRILLSRENLIKAIYPNGNEIICGYLIIYTMDYTQLEYFIPRLI
jgi:flagellar basal body rod protein FlgG